MARGQKRHWQILQNVPKERPSKPVSIDRGIRYTPAGTFAVYVYRDRKDRYIGCYEDIEDAVRARDESAAGNVATVAKRSGKVMLAAFFDETYAPIAAADLKPSAARAMSSRFNVHVRPTLGQKYVAEVDDAGVAWFVASLLRKPVSRQTQREVLSIVRALFDAAVTHGLIARSPASKVKLPARDRRRIAPPSVAVARSVVEAIDDPVARMAAQVMLYTGVRVGECLALSWSDVDFRKNVLRVSKAVDQATGTLQTPKTRNAVRDIPLPSQLAERLFLYRAGQDAGDIPSRDGWLFPDTRRKDSDAMRPPVMWYGDLTKQHWNPAREKVGATTARLHSLRHLYASRLIAARTDVLTVAALLGHHSAAFTLSVYGHWLADSDTIAAQVQAAFT